MYMRTYHCFQLFALTLFSHAIAAVATLEINEPTLDFGDALERSFSATIGQPFAVRLEGCDTCGYTWQVVSKAETRGLKIHGPTNVDPRGARRGGSQLVRFELLASEAMGMDVHFAYKREWDKEPSKTVVLHLTVSQALAVAESAVATQEMKEKTLDFGDALERSFSATIGQPFAVRLEGCDTCGYTWQVVSKAETRGLKIHGPTKVDPRGARRGGSQLVRFELVASEAMSMDVHFAYKREWEKEPSKTVVLHLTVSQALAVAEIAVATQEIKEKTVDFGDALERSFSATIGQPFAVRLEGCHTCGYTWQVVSKAETRGLKIHGPTKVDPRGAHRGGSQLVRFELVASEAMSMNVHFAYKREWEKEPSKTAVLHLTVPAMTFLV